MTGAQRGLGVPLRRRGDLGLRHLRVHLRPVHDPRRPAPGPLRAAGRGDARRAVPRRPAASLAGLMKSYLGLVLGFGLLGGIGMGLGYAAATPAAVRWFGPHRRGLIVGLVVGGYGGAAHLHLPAGEVPHRRLRAVRQLRRAGRAVRGGGGRRRAAAEHAAGRATSRRPRRRPAKPRPAVDRDRLVGRARCSRTWQFYALVFLFIGSAQSGLLVIANADPDPEPDRRGRRVLRGERLAAGRRSAGWSTRPAGSAPGCTPTAIGRAERLRRQRRSSSAGVPVR